MVLLLKNAVNAKIMVTYYYYENIICLFFSALYCKIIKIIQFMNLQIIEVNRRNAEYGYRLRGDNFNLLLLIKGLLLLLFYYYYYLLLLL